MIGTNRAGEDSLRKETSRAETYGICGVLAVSTRVLEQPRDRDAGEVGRPRRTTQDETIHFRVQRYWRAQRRR